MTLPLLKQPLSQRILSIASHCIFWGWNSIFLLIVFAGILPIAGGALILAAVAGAIPFSLSLSFVGLVSVPLACTILGFVKFRRNARQLRRLFYGVEAPLFLLCLVRLFLMREVPAGAAFVLGTIVVAVFIFLVDLVQEDSADLQQFRSGDRPLAAWFELGGTNSGFLGGDNCQSGADVLRHS